MPKWFWSQYKQSANVFSIGEVFNGDVDYVAGYQGSLDALLNYPMYYKLQTAFQKQQSMRAIHDGVTSEVWQFVNNTGSDFEDVLITKAYLFCDVPQK